MNKLVPAISIDPMAAIVVKGDLVILHLWKVVVALLHLPEDVHHLEGHLVVRVVHGEVDDEAGAVGVCFGCL